LYPYCALPFWHGKHSRDTTVLIDLLCQFNVVHYSSLFQYFFSIYYGPYSGFLIFFSVLVCSLFWEQCYHDYDLFDYYSVCFVYLSYQLDLLWGEGGLQSSCPPGCYTYIIVIMDITAQPYYCWWTQLKQSRRTSHLRIYCLKRRRFFTSYIQPVMQQNESITV